MYNLTNRSTIVVLPLPVLPIIPTDSPLLILKVISFKVASSTPGYLKVKFLNSIPPSRVASLITSDASLTSESRFNTLSNLSKEALPCELRAIKFDKAIIGQTNEEK